MRIIIDIPDIAYDWFLTGFPDERDGQMAIEYIRKGKPLPEDAPDKDQN